MARPTKLNDAIEKALCDAFAAGTTIKNACHVAGISPATYNVWMQLADEGDRRYTKLSESIERARAQGTYERLKRIEAAAKGGGHATEVVERTYRVWNPVTKAFDTLQDTTRRVWTVEPNWLADKWWCEHVEADTYSSKTISEVTGKDGGPLAVAAFDYQAAIAPLAPRPVDDSEPPGEAASGMHGPPLG